MALAAAGRRAPPLGFISAQTLAHEVPPLLALQVLVARLAVAGLHPLLLRRQLVAAVLAQALAHELASLVALHLALARGAVTVLHLLLLRGELLLVAAALQALAHEALALVAFQVLVLRLQVAGLHALLLRRKLLGGDGRRKKRGASDDGSADADDHVLQLLR